MIEFICKDKYTFEDLLHIMEILRAPDGCMWDREQNHHSIRHNFIEETYEVAEAIDAEDPVLLQEELGDVLLQVVFHAQMEREAGRFDMNDVADGICKKLIYRHPHIFGATEVASSTEILRNWDDLKRAEKKQKSTTDSIVSVARSLPSLMRADKIQRKASKAGFDWPEISGAAEKVREELDEVVQAVNGTGDPTEEIGDLLFSAVNVARFAKVEPEEALERACDKFIRRFARVEQGAHAAGKTLEDMTLAEMDALWDAAKEQEK